MSVISRLARTWRSMVLIALAMVLGATLGAPALAQVGPHAPRVAATTQTRSASCAGLSFYPRDSDTQYGLAGAWIRDRIYGGGTGIFLCDPGLPNKAVVTKVQFTLVDNSDSAEVKGCALWRGSLALAGSSLDRMASVPSTGLVPETGTVRPADTTIAHSTIDNTTFGYWLQCEINLTTTLDDFHIVGIIGADVIYKISSTNG